MQLMRKDLQLVLSFELSEQVAHQNLIADGRLYFDSVTRLMAPHFERACWDKSCEAGLDILRLLFGSFADHRGSTSGFSQETEAGVK